MRLLWQRTKGLQGFSSQESATVLQLSTSLHWSRGTRTGEASSVHKMSPGLVPQISIDIQRRIKVYVGETGNLRARHAQYLTDGDHLSPLLTAALQDGCTVLRRYKYVVSPTGGSRNLMFVLLLYFG